MAGQTDEKEDCFPCNPTAKKVLEPFGHQVGGRCLIVAYDGETVCKELVPQEHRFYRHLPAELRPFTPRFKGVVQIEFQQKEDGSMEVLAHPPNSDISYAEVHGSGDKLEVSLDHKKCEECVSVTAHHNGLQLTSSVQGKEEQSVKNPWSVHCQCLQLQKLKTSPKNGTLRDFILLENIVSQFSCPSILDLKMGNKTHDDYQCREKQARQQARLDSSTSKSLGIRIAGMQVYQTMAKDFRFHNKYYGFELSKEGFQGALRSFFHNGHRLREDVIQPFICKLKDLHSCLSRQDSYRFYSSSLLLSYDGNGNQSGNDSKSGRNLLENGKDICSHCSEGHTSKVEVRMIDFGRCFHGLSQKNCKKRGPDKGYLFGLENLLQLLKEIQLDT